MQSSPPSARAHLPCVTVSVVVLAALTGCGAKESSTPTQVAAKVDKAEITIHQVGAALAQQQVKPDQAPKVERQVLDRLIDRELAVQKAGELKLDRDPKVVQAIESARKEIIARAYADKLGEGASRPTPADVKKYYDDNPELFRDRKIYQLQEFAIQGDASQIEGVKSTLASVRSADELTAQLKAAGLKFASTQTVRAAEQVPLSLLPALAKMGEGQVMVSTTANGASVLLVRGTRAQPVDEERAARAIEQFLLNEQKRKLLSDDLKALRASAKIEYLGRFAASAPVASEPPAATAAEVAASAAAGLETKPAAELPAVADVPAKPASGIDPASVNKGLGLK